MYDIYNDIITIQIFCVLPIYLSPYPQPVVSSDHFIFFIVLFLFQNVIQLESYSMPFLEWLQYAFKFPLSFHDFIDHFFQH